jgi:repressor LexA
VTEAQGRVLEALRSVTADGWPATVREVMLEAGLASPSTVHAHLVALERLGLAETNRSRRMGWRPVKPTAVLS